MKKLLHYFKNDENGSVFIYLFFLATLLIFITFTLLFQLEKNQEISQLDIEQLHLDMIHQLTYQTVIDQSSDIDLSVDLSYSFPIGKAKVTFGAKNNGYVSIRITAFREPSFQKVKSYHVKLE